MGESQKTPQDRGNAGGNKGAGAARGDPAYGAGLVPVEGQQQPLEPLQEIPFLADPTQIRDPGGAGHGLQPILPSNQTVKLARDDQKGIGVL